MIKYNYETDLGAFELEAESDDDALAILQEQFGPRLLGIFIVYTEQDLDDCRTVWKRS